MNETNENSMDQVEPVEPPMPVVPARPNFFWPLALVAVGVVFLLRNMGVLREDSWHLITALWPLIPILLGLDGLIRRQGLVGPVFLMALGGVFLLSTLGVVEWDVWDMAFKLWPILIIAAGLDLLVARRSMAGALLSIVLLLLILLGALWVLLAGSGFGSV